MSGKKYKITGYSFEADFLESDVEPILEKALKDRIVCSYDTGRGTFVWFNGKPSPELRKIRDQIKSIIGVK